MRYGVALVGPPHRSLPSRERGLKYVVDARLPDDVLSLPSRERGLKSLIHGLPVCPLWSLPSRERGLKFY